MAGQSEKESLNFTFGGALVTKLYSILVTPWTIAHQAPLSVRFCRQECWVIISFSRGSS